MNVDAKNVASKSFEKGAEKQFVVYPTQIWFTDSVHI